MDFTKAKNTKGITMIALIITIMVLLILAGTSINMAINTGIIEQSKNVSLTAEFGDVMEAWNARKAKLQMNNVSKKDMNYSNLQTAEYTIPGTNLKEKLIVGVNISDYLNSKIEIKYGEIVYRKRKCDKNEIKFFQEHDIKEYNELTSVIEDSRIDIKNIVNKIQIDDGSIHKPLPHTSGE